MGHTCKDSQLETLVLRDCSVEEFESSHRTIKFDRRIEINTEDQVGVASKHLDTLVGRSSSVPDTKRSRCSANRRTMLDRRYHSRDLLIDGSEPLPALTAPLPTPLPPLGIASLIPISYYDELPLHLPKTAIIQGTGGCVWKDNALVDDSDDEEEDSVYSLSNGKDTDTGNSSGQYNLENKGKSKEEVIKEESDGKEDSDHSLNSEDKERDTGS
ncbi:hypothetical protein Bca4012_031519 [Brassica carinata]